jgi:predicted GIY-YIG superfamily endonuclease
MILRIFAYLIRLERPIGSARHSAQFYLGIARCWLNRYRQHRAGCGAKMLAAAAVRGICFAIVRLWVFGSYAAARSFEVWAKRSVKNHHRLLDLSPEALSWFDA